MLTHRMIPVVIMVVLVSQGGTAWLTTYYSNAMESDQQGENIWAGYPSEFKNVFEGPRYAPNEIIVAGDINGDCRVNFLDFQLIALHWLEER